MDIGSRLRAARLGAGYTAEQAAAILGCHPNTIYGSENEKLAPKKSVEWLRRLAEVYGTTLSRLFAEDPPRERVPVEMRPLADVLLPFTREARESIVRNIASNLRFMGMMYSEGRELRPEVTPSHEPRATDEGTDPLADR